MCVGGGGGEGGQTRDVENAPDSVQSCPVTLHFKINEVKGKR